MLYNRVLSLPNLLVKKSFFLLGPRATGKSFLIKKQLGDKALILDLLNSDMYLRLITSPSDLGAIIEASNKDIIVIDEVQRVPDILNEVHRLIESKGITFLLTGSSARKLKKRDVNLLAGRAWQANLYPLTSYEIPDFNLDTYLLYGGLPVVCASEYPSEELHAYINTYLKEEIQFEALVRKLAAFTRFLQVSALTSGQMINFTNISNDTSIPVSTVKEYYQILEDTLLGFFLPAWTKSVKRKATSTNKFYYFDIGVRNKIAKIENLDINSNLYGQAFEHFIILEIRAYLSYTRKHIELSYWRSKHGHEVDLLIGDDIAIEIKTTNKVVSKHTKGLKFLEEEKIFNRYILVSFDTINTKREQIETIYWKDFLSLLWNDKLIL